MSNTHYFIICEWIQYLFTGFIIFCFNIKHYTVHINNQSRCSCDSIGFGSLSWHLFMDSNLNLPTSQLIHAYGLKRQMCSPNSAFIRKLKILNSKCFFLVLIFPHDKNKIFIYQVSLYKSYFFFLCTPIILSSPDTQ